MAGPSAWNSLPEYLRDPTVGRNSFRKQLKTFLFATFQCIQRIRVSTIMSYMYTDSYYITLDYSSRRTDYELAWLLDTAALEMCL